MGKITFGTKSSMAEKAARVESDCEFQGNGPIKGKLAVTLTRKL